MITAAVLLLSCRMVDSVPILSLNPLAWYEGESFSSGVWRDKLGNAANDISTSAVYASADTFPTATEVDAQSIVAVRLDAKKNNSLALPASVVPPDVQRNYTIFFVVKRLTALPRMPLFFRPYTINRAERSHEVTYGLDSNNVYSVMVEYGEPWLVAHFYTVGEWHMIVYRYQGVAYGRATLRVNGDYATDKCIALGCPYWPLRNTSYAGIGSSTFESVHFDGHIGDMIFFDSALSDCDTAQVEQELNAKYAFKRYQASTACGSLAPTPAPTPAPTTAPTPSPTTAPTPAPTTTTKAPTPAPTTTTKAPTPANTMSTSGGDTAATATTASTANGDTTPSATTSADTTTTAQSTTSGATTSLVPGDSTLSSTTSASTSTTPVESDTTSMAFIFVGSATTSRVALVVALASTFVALVL